MIRKEFKRDAVVEAQIFGKPGIAVHYASAESYCFRVAPPDEEAHPVCPCGCKAAEIPSGQLCKNAALNVHSIFRQQLK
jgi:hypothetical protein